jgi:hypothetical protein
MVHSNTGMRKRQSMQDNILSQDKILPAERLAGCRSGQMMIWKSSARAWSMDQNSLLPPTGRTGPSECMETTGIAWIKTQIENQHEGSSIVVVGPS